MSSAQATNERPPLPQPNFEEVRTSGGKLLFELDIKRMIVRVKINGRFECVDLLSYSEQVSNK